MSLLEVRGVHKGFGDVPVLKGVDLDIPSGALAAVLGPSGCGKTTLLRVIAGFERAGAGTVNLGGRVLTGPTTHVAAERRQIAVVPQEGALFPHLSVAGNVAFGLQRRGLRRDGLRRPDRRNAARVGELLELVGLAGLGDRMPAELSGGQQQRVAVARALAPDPHVVLLDEPFSALDAGLRASVRADVRGALHAAGATAVLVTHDQEEALSTADLVAVMRDGRVVQAGAPQDLYRAPVDLQVAQFVGEAVLLPAHVTGGLATTALGALPLGGAVADGRGTVVVRPEQVQMTALADGVRARVRDTVFYGHDASVLLDVDAIDGTRLPVLCRTQGDLPAAADGDVGLRVVGPVTYFPDGP